MNKDAKVNAAEFFGIPAEVAVKMARVQLVGTRFAFIENYDLIASYSPECVRLATADGYLEISGSNLEIADAERGYIAIRGVISSVSYK